MFRRLTAKLSYANVMSTIAMFVVVAGGTAYAASLAKNSVGSAQIKAGAVKTADLGKSAVTSAKVKNGSLQAADFKAGQLPAGPAGAPGAQGPAGPQGEKGDKGEPGATSVVVREAIAQNITAGQVGDATAECAAGERLVGGGGGMAINDSQSYGANHTETDTLLSTPINASSQAPGQAGTAVGWRVSARNDGGSTRDLRVYALCAKP